MCWVHRVGFSLWLLGSGVNLVDGGEEFSRSTDTSAGPTGTRIGHWVRSDVVAGGPRAGAIAGWHVCPTADGEEFALYAIHARSPCAVHRRRRRVPQRRPTRFNRSPARISPPRTATICTLHYIRRSPCTAAGWLPDPCTSNISVRYIPRCQAVKTAAHGPQPPGRAAIDHSPRAARDAVYNGRDTDAAEPPPMDPGSRIPVRDESTLTVEYIPDDDAVECSEVTVLPLTYYPPRLHDSADGGKEQALVMRQYCEDAVVCDASLSTNDARHSQSIMNTSIQQKLASDTSELPSASSNQCLFATNRCVVWRSPGATYTTHHSHPAMSSCTTIRMLQKCPLHPSIPPSLHPHSSAQPAILYIRAFYPPAPFGTCAPTSKKSKWLAGLPHLARDGRWDPELIVSCDVVTRDTSDGRGCMNATVSLCRYGRLRLCRTYMLLVAFRDSGSFCHCVCVGAPYGLHECAYSLAHVPYAPSNGMRVVIATSNRAENNPQT
ncbi:hypothetical protein EDC01DRAFT_633875 [Geopyxis carbonaria]|nr:hypothetical protein EDC01DRAFT_633875 [Geopyxis carbonaria]